MAVTVRRVVAVLGTTASGKSELAVRLAKAFDGEAISADSRQVYVGLDIGTGKLMPAEREDIEHHLIDVVQPGRAFSLADYQREAYRAIDSVLAGSRLPIIVGGSGLHVRAVVQGYMLDETGPDERLRAELEQLPAARLAEMLLEENPELASQVDLANRRRVVRALELGRAGRTQVSRRTAPRYACLQLGLTWERATLLGRIDERLRRRLDAGMIEEVQGLLDAGVPATFLEALGLEYRYVLWFLTGELESREQLFDRLRFAIHRFAKRQSTWFRRDSEVHWLDSSGDYVAEAKSLVRAFLASPDDRLQAGPVSVERRAAE